MVSSDLPSNTPNTARSRSLPFGRESFERGVDDLWRGLLSWPTWWILAQNDVRQRYRRSKIGQFWLTISTALQIGGMALVFSGIFNQPLEQYLIFLGTGIIVWGMISTMINELSVAFNTSDVYLRSYPGPRSIVVYRVIVRNLIVSGHNFVLIPILWLVGGGAFNINILLFFPGLFLFISIMASMAFILGPLCARFRDIPMIVTNFVQLMFFLTPVMYKPEQLGHRMKWLGHYNPLSSVIEIMRAPLLGIAPDLWHYGVCFGLLALGLCIAVPFYARFRARIVYWL